MEFAFPPDSWLTMHLQQFWFQLCFEHQVAISCMFLVVPHGQLGHFAPGQFPPQVSAAERTRIRARQRRIFIRFSRLRFITEIYDKTAKLKD